MYDFASANENMKHYNQVTPPIYDVTNVNVPVALYYGAQDWLATVSDVQFLRQNLPNIVDDLNVEKYNHLDFIWALDAKQMVYDRMLQLMSNYD